LLEISSGRFLRLCGEKCPLLVAEEVVERTRGLLFQTYDNAAQIPPPREEYFLITFGNPTD
jgi:hypothetical protein